MKKSNLKSISIKPMIFLALISVMMLHYSCEDNEPVVLLFDPNTINVIFDLSSGMSKSDFDKAVLDERNYELAFETNR